MLRSCCAQLSRWHESNLRQAVRWCPAAAKQREPMADLAPGELHADGIGVPISLAGARAHRRAATSLHTAADARRRAAPARLMPAATAPESQPCRRRADALAAMPVTIPRKRAGH